MSFDELEISVCWVGRVSSPNVPAVAEFRKAMEETEKQQKSTP